MAARSTRRSDARAKSRAERWISRFFWIGVACLCAFLSFERIAEPVMAISGYRRVEHYAPLLREVSDEFGIDANLLAGVMMAESSGRLDAVSDAGALGLFQLMPPTASERARLLKLPDPSREDLLSDARLNARLAGSYLRWLERRYKGELEPMLVAYNAGPGRLDRWVKEHGGYAQWRATRPSSSGVLGYAAKVQKYARRFEERDSIRPVHDHPPAPAQPRDTPSALVTRLTVGPPAPSAPTDD